MDDTAREVATLMMDAVSKEFVKALTDETWTPGAKFVVPFSMIPFGVFTATFEMTGTADQITWSRAA